MNEQVSIDDEFIEKVIDAVGMSPVAWDCVDPRELCRAVIDVYLDSNEEIERLRRLDENVKRVINNLTYFAESKDGKNYVVNKPVMLPLGLMSVPVDDVKELLESLYE